MTPKATTIYLDYAAATPLEAAVLAAMQPYFATKFYNPSANYAAAVEVRASVEAARTQVAYWLGVRPNEIIFTAGGTEANNLAIHGVMRQFPQANIVVSAIEHESVLAPANYYDCRIVGVKADGTLDLDELRQLIDEKTALVSIMYANNEIGTIQPLREISQLIEAKRRERDIARGLPLYFHTDACQAANYLDLHTARIGVDLLTLNGGKLYGPKQSGALYVKRTVTLQPLVDGGGQERGLRSGTENVGSMIGLAKALDMAQTMRPEETARLQDLQRHFMALTEQQLPNAVINGSQRRRLPNNIHLTIPGYDNERLLMQLDERGIQAAAGSACSASDELPSHVLHALGLSDSEARSSIRLTMGRATTDTEVTRTVSVLKELTVA